MAVWRVHRDLSVTYVERGYEQSLGRADESTLADVEAWASCEAKQWDLVVSWLGTYVRQQTPTTRA